MSTGETTLRDALAAEFRGEIVTPEDDGYEEARRVYNAMIDKRPALVARCADVADVMSAVREARESGVTVAIRGGGHNGGGLGTVDAGMVIDLSAMRGIRVDPEDRTALVQGGCTLADFDHATHAFGLATSAGIIGTTGIGGLTLGGGIGHLTRKYGLTIDNLLEADVVLADGRLVRASESENADLFWAIRGGGGNFGVVTSFQFRLHPVDSVAAGPTLWPLETAADVLRRYNEFIAGAPRELNGFFAFLTVPPAPPFPEELHFAKMCGVVWCYTGSPDDANELLRPMMEVGEPALYGVGEMPYTALQTAFDDLYTPGLQWYWRADFVDELGEEAIGRHVAHAWELPTMHSTMHLYPIDGAVHDVAPTETAFANRGSRFAEVIVGVDPDPANAETISNWTKDYWEDLHRFSGQGAYVNFLMDEGEERVRATYGPNYDRLREIKAKYDPTNLFHVNQNIRPA